MARIPNFKIRLNNAAFQRLSELNTRWQRSQRDADTLPTSKRATTNAGSRRLPAVAGQCECEIITTVRGGKRANAPSPKIHCSAHLPVAAGEHRGSRACEEDRRRPDQQWPLRVLLARHLLHNVPGEALRGSAWRGSWTDFFAGRIAFTAQLSDVWVQRGRRWWWRTLQNAKILLDQNRI